MRELARLVEQGEDSWDAIFSGDSPNTDLLHAHLERMMAEHRDAVAEEPDMAEPRRDVPDDGDDDFSEENPLR